MTALLLIQPVRAAERYPLDSVNTHVSLEVRGFGVSWISAQFEQLKGELVPARRDLSRPGETGSDPSAHVDVTIQTASLRCDSAHLNAKLLSAEWFDAEHYPEIVYRSERIIFDGKGGAVVEGNLTLHGHTRGLALEVKHWSCAGRSGMGESCSFNAHGRLRRSDYGLPHGLLEGGDEVEILIDSSGAP